jgi:hypothetical protein
MEFRPHRVPTARGDAVPIQASRHSIYLVLLIQCWGNWSPAGASREFSLFKGKKVIYEG